MKTLLKTGLGMSLAAALSWMVPCASAQQRGAAWDDGVHWGAKERPAAAREPQTVSIADDGDRGTGGGWLSERLTIGVGVRHAHLSENYRTPDRESGSTFVGRLNMLNLENENDVMPVVTYWLARYLRVGATWERLHARAYNYNVGDPYGQHAHSDGVAKLSGPVFTLEGMIPLFDDTLFPHAGAGVLVGMGDFKEDTFWHYGYTRQEDYEAAGKPTKGRSGYLREIHSDDTLGWLVTAGVAWRPVKHLQVDLDVRQTWAETDCEYGYMLKSGWDPHRKGEFTFDNVTWSLSASYVF